MDGSQAIATFAFAAIPGVLVLEILEFGRPRLREREASRALALYLMVSAAVWAVAVALLGADRNLVDIVARSPSGAGPQVSAYEALAWKLVVVSIALGSLGSLSIWAAERVAHRVEKLRRDGRPMAKGKFGDALISWVRFSFAWDAMVIRLRRDPHAQAVQIRLLDGSVVYGILSSGGRADFQADGRGLVLARELIEVEDRLVEVPGSNGIFISPEAVATVAVFDYEDVGPGDKVDL
jgi:hypothetical protein